MPLKMSDEKIITLLDLAVDRAEVTEGVCSALERLKLYQENLDLMERTLFATSGLRHSVLP